MSEAINFTQHLMPDGRLQEIFIERPQDIDPEVWSKAYVDAEKIRSAGYSFHAEMLSDYSTISLTCVGYDPSINEENDIMMVLGSNGSSIPLKVIELIDKSMEKLVEWRIIGEEPD